jgi:hypothetical protein
MEPKPVTSHLVVLVNDRGQALAVPGTLVVKEGEKIAFKSVGAGDVSLVFPRGILLAAPDDKEPVTEHRITGDQTPEFTACLKGVKPGIFTYAAYCRAVNDVALGGSQPRIIIYR